jgi:hypothetical protein
MEVQSGDGSDDNDKVIHLDPWSGALFCEQAATVW